MKKILMLGICLMVSGAMAQELFPELAGLGGGKRTVAAPVVKGTNEAQVVKPTEATTQEDDLPQIAQTLEEESAESQDGEIIEEKPADEPDLFAAPTQEETPAVPTQEEEEEEDDPEQRITVYMDDAQATLTPNRDFSYCFGVLKFLNTLKRPVQALSFTLKYGDLSMDYNPRNLMPNQEQTGTINLIGTACEQILDMPEITIKKCVVEEMSEANCKKKFEFLPLRGE